MIIFALFLVISPDDGYIPVFVFLVISLFAYAVKNLFYYFTMARHMVDSKFVLYKGIIALDFAVVTVSLQNVPIIFVMIYLAGSMIFVNVIDIIGALDARKCSAPRWKLKLTFAIIGNIISAVCLINYNSGYLVSYIYAFELVYSAVIRIVNALRDMQIIYIQ